MNLKLGSLPAIVFHDEANEQWEQQINRMADRFWLVQLTFQGGRKVSAYLRQVERDADGMPMICYVEDDGTGRFPAQATVESFYPLPGSQPFLGAVVVRLDAELVESILVY